MLINALQLEDTNPYGLIFDKTLANVSLPSRSESAGLLSKSIDPSVPFSAVES